MALQFPKSPVIGDSHMIQGVVYEYSGNNVWTIKRGKIFTVSAKDLDFDNQNSNLSSLFTESAIKEVNTNLNALTLSLNKVDNVADIDKPISTATQATLDTKLDKTETAVNSDKLGNQTPAHYLNYNNFTNVPTTEFYQDLVGTMVNGNSETGSITVSYNDVLGKLDFHVGKVTDSELLDGYDHSAFPKLATSNFFNEDQTFGKDVVITGNLLVKGESSLINTEEVKIADNIMTLNSNVTGTPIENAGIEVERGTSNNVKVIWNEGSDQWELIGTDGVTSHRIFHAGNLTAKVLPTLDPNNTGSSNTQGQLDYLSGRINEANGVDVKLGQMFVKQGANIIFKGDLIPETDQLSIGSPTRKIKELFVSADTIYLGDNTQLAGTAITIDGGENPTSMSQQPTLLASRLVARPFTYNPGGGNITMRPAIEFQDEQGISNPISFNSATGEFSFDRLGNYGEGSIVCKDAKIRNQLTSGDSRFDGDVTLGYNSANTVTVRGILDIQTPVTFSESATLGDGNDTIIVNAGASNTFTVSSKYLNLGNTGNMEVKALKVRDPSITLHSDTTDIPTENVSINIDRGNKAMVSVRWNEAVDKWELTKDGTNFYEIANSTHIQALQQEISELKAGKLNRYNREVATSFTMSAGDSIGVKAVGGVVSGTLPTTIKVGDSFHIFNSKRSDSDVHILNPSFNIYDLYDTYNAGDGIALERGDSVTLIAVSSTELEVR